MLFLLMSVFVRACTHTCRGTRRARRAHVQVRASEASDKNTADLSPSKKRQEREPKTRAGTRAIRGKEKSRHPKRDR